MYLEDAAEPAWHTPGRRGRRRRMTARGTRSRVLLAAATLLIAGLATPVTAAPSAKAPALAGTVTVTGSRTASIPVRLTMPLAINRSTYGATVRTTGAGRAVGFLLVKDGEDVIRLGFTRLSLCEKAGCVDKEPLKVTSTRANRDAQDRSVYPAGNYRLYVIADGKPTTTTFRLPGLSGRQTLSPTKPAGPAIVRPSVAQDVQAGGQRPILTGGVEPSQDSDRGFGLFAIQADSREWVGAAVGFCFYQNKPREEIAYAPGCPTAESQAGTPDFLANPLGFPLQRSYLSGVDWNNGPPAAFGGYFAAAARNESVRHTAFMMYLDD